MTTPHIYLHSVLWTTLIPEGVELFQRGRVMVENSDMATVMRTGNATLADKVLAVTYQPPGNSNMVGIVSATAIPGKEYTQLQHYES